MNKSIDLLKWQFQLTWQLAAYHLPSLTTEMCVWEPSANSWNIRMNKEGKWRPDFSEVEPNPIPTATIGWITWQMLWWWQSTLNALDGQPLLKPEDIHWPGDAKLVIQKIENLKSEWETRLASFEDTDLERKILHLWPEPTPLWQSITWLNSELMKNISEIGYIRLLYQSK